MYYQIRRTLSVSAVRRVEALILYGILGQRPRSNLCYFSYLTILPSVPKVYLAAGSRSLVFVIQ